MSGLSGFAHPFYRPLWRRVLVVAAALGWAGVEALTGNPGWAVLFAAAGAWAAWGLLIAYAPAAAAPEPAPEPATPESATPDKENPR